MPLDREQAEQIISNGGTIADIAHHSNDNWEDTARKLVELGVQAPNATLKTPADLAVSHYLGLLDGDVQHPSAEELVVGPDGHPVELPTNFSTARIDVSAVFERFHGKDGWVDPYNGAPTGPVDEHGMPTRVNGRVVIVNTSPLRPSHPRNFLITNIETLSEATIDLRYCRWMPPIREEFVFRNIANKWDIGLSIQRPYDKTVGGTYSSMYMEQLFERWVRNPLNEYATKQDPEREPVFKLNTPFELAWWVWKQLTHCGLLKGLIEMAVASVDGRTAVLRDDDVMAAVLGFHLKDRSSSSLLVSPDQIPNQKFSPGSLLMPR